MFRIGVSSVFPNVDLLKLELEFSESTIWEETFQLWYTIISGCTECH